MAAADVVPEIDLPARFAGPTAQSTGSSNEPWWTVYADPTLAELVATLHAANPSIEQARARLDAAQAAAHAGAAAGRPRLDLDAGAATAQGPLINAAGGEGSLFTARLGATWEIDLFGRLKDERRAERLDAESSEALLAETQLLMEGLLARRWLALRQLVVSSASAQAMADLTAQAAAIVARQQAQGQRSAAEVDQARQRAAAAQDVRDEMRLKCEIAASEIGYLIGASTPPALPQATTEKLILPEIAAGLPAELLVRRPDIAAARSRLLASDQRLRVARKGWLPRLGLTASGGTASASLADLLTTGAASLLASAIFSIPVLDGGRHKARVAGQRAERDLATAQYRERVLGALRDVNDHLGAYHACRAAVRRMEAVEESAATLRTTARSRLARGMISKLALLNAEIVFHQRHAEQMTQVAACAGTSVDLFMALGGRA